MLNTRILCLFLTFFLGSYADAFQVLPASDAGSILLKKRYSSTGEYIGDGRPVHAREAYQWTGVDVVGAGYSRIFGDNYNKNRGFIEFDLRKLYPVKDTRIILNLADIGNVSSLLKGPNVLNVSAYDGDGQVTVEDYNRPAGRFKSLTTSREIIEGFPYQIDVTEQILDRIERKVNFIGFRFDPRDEFTLDSLGASKNSGYPVPYLSYTPEASGLQVTAMKWNPELGGIDVIYRRVDMTREGLISLAWSADGQSPGRSIRTFSIGADGADGTDNVLWINPKHLLDAPQSAKFLTATVCGTLPPNDRQSLQDVVLVFGDSRADVLTDRTKSLVQEIGRKAGEAQIRVTSTFRTISEQIDAMFENIVNLGTVEQLGLYGRGGDIVIEAFKQHFLEVFGVDYDFRLVGHKTLANDNRLSLKAAMLAAFPANPRDVSKHCGTDNDYADYTRYAAIDLSLTAIMPSRRLKFQSILVSDPRIIKVLSPFTHPRRDPAFHIEVNQ